METPKYDDGNDLKFLAASMPKEDYEKLLKKVKHVEESINSSDDSNDMQYIVE